jgi:hypothetical protein
MNDPSPRGPSPARGRRRSRPDRVDSFASRRLAGRDALPHDAPRRWPAVFEHAGELLHCDLPITAMGFRLAKTAGEGGAP